MITSLDDWIAQLRATEKTILVEGRKDRKALELLGITNVLTVVGTPMYKLVESIAGNPVIILTDLDPAGRKHYARLKHELQKHGAKIDNQFREFLLRETNLTVIEGLTTYSRRTS